MGFVVLRSYPNYVEAHIDRGVLEEEGIPCWLKDENTVTIDPILTNAVGGIKLMVSQELAERAHNFLESLRKEQKKTLACPVCGSHNLELVSTPRKAMNWITALVTFFLGRFAIAPEMVQHCFDCGHEFPAPEN